MQIAANDFIKVNRAHLHHLHLHLPSSSALLAFVIKFN